MSKTAIIIPARWASSRLPGKPMIRISGKPMIQWVWEAAVFSKADNVFVATDHGHICSYVNAIGGEVIITSPDLRTGTERVCAAYKTLSRHFDFIINIQGDEPLIDTKDINKLIKKRKSSKADVVTMISPLNKRQLTDRNTVKAYVDDKKIKMFTRSALYDKSKSFYKHNGIYAFTHKSLLKIDKLISQTPNEIGENLEQLRWADNNCSFDYVKVNSYAGGIDTIEDLAEIESLLS